MNAEPYDKGEWDGVAPGATLAAARAAERLSVVEVARHLKLSVAQVEALEAGDFERLPGPVFVRGFVRNYARLLKLDADGLLRRIDPELAGHTLSPAAPPSVDIPFPPAAPRRWPAFALLALLVLVVLVLHELYWSEPAVAPVGLTAPTPAPAPAVPQPETVEKQNAAPVSTAPVSTDPGVSIPQLPAVPAEIEKQGSLAPVPEEESQAVPSPLVATPVAAPSHGVVHMRFDEESWVEIRDRNGKRIFYELSPKGTERLVAGDPPLAIVIGNARGVRLTFDGRPVELARHTKVDVARLVLE